MRYWTVEEARAYVPRLRTLLEALVQPAMTVARARTNGHASPPQHDILPETALAELNAGDIIVRDPVAGLIDFHAVDLSGAVYLLCWRFADGDTVAWWHRPEEGFAGRKPLPKDPT
ncbi:MAG TPA: DUF2203 family protein [Acidimicrobiales bacterium]|nr:DUF2203 family protein [Acidimicrobiales bacterium]